MLQTTKSLLAALVALGLCAPQARADQAGEPILKIVNFTADWCPNCQILNPRMDEAVARFAPGEIEIVDLDLTAATRRADEETRQRATIDAIRAADRHQAGYLWDWYGGITGLAAIVAADTGEPIACMNRALSVDQIETRLEHARILALKAPAGARKPEGPDCPPPMR